MWSYLAAPLVWGNMLFLFYFILAMPVVMMLIRVDITAVLPYLAISFIVSYVMVALLYLLRYKVLRFIFGGVFSVILVVMAAIDIFSIKTYGEELNREYVALVFETNYNEIFEFLKSYLSAGYIISLGVCVICLVGIVFVGWKSCCRYNNKFGLVFNRYPIVVNSIILLTCILGCGNISYAEKHPLKRTLYFFNHKNYPDLAEYYTNPKMCSIADTHPSKVVIVIGESLTKSHCSLYGYNLCTNPKLEKLKEQGNLYVFDNVTSLGTKTIRSLKSILSTYREEGTNWWEHLSVIEMLKACGYSTYWRSNQAKEGVYDVFATQYSKLCDDAKFTCDMSDASFYDGDLLNMDIDSDNGSIAVIYHLAGSHPSFVERYPADFTSFNEDEYRCVPAHQRRNYLTYDTSVLYNDSIVGSIMDRFKNDDAVVLYFPDHGLDFYDTSDSYCGHAMNHPQSVEAARQIPFVIYVSDIYKSHHPDVIEDMESNLHKSWCVSETIYTLMELIGYTIEDKSTVRKYSLI